MLFKNGLIIHMDNTLTGGFGDNAVWKKSDWTKREASKRIKYQKIKSLMQQQTATVWICNFSELGKSRVSIKFHKLWTFDNLKKMKG